MDEFCVELHEIFEQLCPGTHQKFVWFKNRFISTYLSFVTNVNSIQTGQ
jgi:2-keto-3-deoxy-galactonokinase